MFKTPRPFPQLFGLSAGSGRLLCTELDVTDVLSNREPTFLCRGDDSTADTKVANLDTLYVVFVIEALQG